MCKKVVFRTLKNIGKNVFCSHSCSAKFTNRHRVRKLRTRHCSQCNKLLYSKTQNLLCSPCDKKKKLEEWISGRLSLSTKYGYSKLIKDYLLDKYQASCMLCGFSGKNPVTGKSVLQIDHIDGNYQNNLFHNVRLICPNCHTMTPNYGILNLGNGRKWKSKYTIRK